ncbi:lipid II flippase MurJ [Actinomycetospora sp. CA-101289]|uniref:lipid II flippase MurJ n=1 Tax=Actinomycetospora sp. CA-101289 TaxID=3239893 RepID=UPI003D95D0AA
MVTPVVPLPAGPGPTAARGSLVVAGWTVVSRATGLLRVVAVGAAFGPTWFANAFQATNQVPNLTYEVMAGPVLALVIVPAVVQGTVAGRPDGAPRLLGGVTGLLLTASGALAVLLVLASPLAARALTVGVDDDDRVRAFRVTVLLLVCVAPQVVLYTLAYLGAAAQQARHRFAVAAAAPAVENLVLTAVVVGTAVAWGTGGEVGSFPTELVVVLGLGSTFAVAVHAAIQVAGAAWAGVPLRPARWRGDALARAVGDRLRRSVRVAALPAAGVFMLIAVAATVPGGVTVFWLAYTLGAVPTALGARAVATAVLPDLARTADGDRRAFAVAWRRALGYSSFVSVPALLLLVVFATPIAAVLAVGEMRSPAVVAQLAACIALIGVSQVFGAAYEMGRQALFARLDLRGARRATDLGLVATLAVGLAALAAPPAARPAVLCLAVIARDATATAVVLRRLRRGIRPERLVDRRRLAVVLLAGAATAPALVAGHLLVDAVPPGGPGAVAVLAAAGVGVVALFVGALRGGLRVAGRHEAVAPW